MRPIAAIDPPPRQKRWPFINKINKNLLPGCIECRMSIHAKKPNTLLVDDDDFALMCLRGIFESHFSDTDNIPLTECSCGQQAVEALLGSSTDENRYELLMLDYELHDMTATEVLRKVQNAASQNLKLPFVVIISGNVMEGARRSELTQLGAKFFVEKPLTAAAMGLILDNVTALRVV